MYSLPRANNHAHGFQQRVQHGIYLQEETAIKDRTPKALRAAQNVRRQANTPQNSTPNSTKSSHTPARSIPRRLFLATCTKRIQQPPTQLADNRTHRQNPANQSAPRASCFKESAAVTSYDACMNAFDQDKDWRSKPRPQSRNSNCHIHGLNGASKLLHVVDSRFNQNMLDGEGIHRQKQRLAKPLAIQGIRSCPVTA